MLAVLAPLVIALATAAVAVMGLAIGFVIGGCLLAWPVLMLASLIGRLLRRVPTPR